jgi:parvulin-like peptidyl-prolyl isomerase
MPTEKITNRKHVAHLEVVRRQDRAIRIGAIIIALLVIGIVSYGILSNTVFLQYRQVASVNGDVIRVSEFQKQVKLYRLELINRFQQYYQFAQMFGVQDPLNDPNFGGALQQIYSQLNVPENAGQQVLDLLINDRLIRQEAARRGITVSAEDVDKALQEGLGYYASGTPTPTLTATPFELPALNPTQLALVTITPTPSPFVSPTSTPTATLDPNVTPTATATSTPTATAGPTSTPESTSTPEPTATPYTLEGYNTAFDEEMKTVSENTGMSKDDYRKFFEGNLLREKLLADVTKDLKPSEEQVWARHILVADEETAKKVVERLKAGEDFAKLAAELSIDTSNKDKGGDLGWFGKGTMVAPFEEAAFALAVGQVSEPVKTDFGWHIIQVLGHEERPLDANAFEQYKQKVFNDFLKKLRDESKVVTADDFWKTIVPTEPVLQQ